MPWRAPNLAATCPADSQLATCSSFGYTFLYLLTQLYAGSQDERIQKQRGWRDEVTQDEEYDFIVAGAGASGCVVASRLSENSRWKVLLLEAGGEQPDVALVPALSPALRGSSADWGFRTQPDGRSCLARAGGRCSWTRGKLLGGSTSIHSPEYIRGHKSDFDTWASLGNDGWSYDDVLPYFKKSEHNLASDIDPFYHGTQGDLPVSDPSYRDDATTMIQRAMNWKGLKTVDLNGPTSYGTAIAQTLTRDGQRVSACDAFLQPSRYQRPNLVVRVDSEVTRVLVRDGRAYGVSYTKDGKRYNAVARKEVVLSSGVVNSPKLLMLSGIGPREHLNECNIKVIRDLPVGRNLQDHVALSGLVIALNRTSTLVSREEILRQIRDFQESRVKSGPLSTTGPSSAWSFYNVDRSARAPQVGLHFAGTVVEEYLKDPVGYEALSVLPTSYYNGLVPRPMILDVKSRGRVRLDCSNPLGPPLIDANYFQDPDDLDLLVRGARFILDLERSEAFRSRDAYFVRDRLPACRGHSWGSSDYLRCLAVHYTSSSDHQVGSCRMGPDGDEEAVVDPRLRVHGVRGLRVVDESIMPVGVRGVPSAAIIMIGERGAAFIIEEWTGDETGPEEGHEDHGPHGPGPDAPGPHGPGPDGPGPDGHGPHGPGPDGPGPDGHGPHGPGPDGPGPDGHGPHGPGPDGPGPDGHGPHGPGPDGHGPGGNGPHGPGSDGPHGPEHAGPRPGK